MTAWGAHGTPAPLTLRAAAAGALGRAHGRGAERGEQRDQPDLRPRDRPRQQAEAAAARGALEHARGVGLHARVLRCWRGSLAWLAAPAGLGRTASASGSCSSRASWCGPTRRRRFRTKRHGLWANITIAIPRGMLLKVAGWSTVKTIFDPEPWFIGTIFGLFVLGASTTKDFADIEGDRAGGCQTLPILYGVKGAAWMIAPFFVLPFLLIPIGVRTGSADRQPAAAGPARAAAWSSTASTPSTCWCGGPRSSRSPRTIPRGRTCT